MPMLKIVAVLALLLSAAPVTANELIGVASVIDADTLEIRGVRIRLHGIDAPESRQLCRRSSGDRAVQKYVGSAPPSRLGPKRPWAAQACHRGG